MEPVELGDLAGHSLEATFAVSATAVALFIGGATVLVWWFS